MTNELELYFHIPFCLKKCKYCDFLSFGVDSLQMGGKTMARYLDSLIRETVMRAGDYRDYRVVSVFVGGGTPSVVRPEFLAELMAAVREHYQLAEDVEITIEVNPGTVDERALRCYRQAGINRLSIGLQSADNGELAALGRVHTYGQFLGAYYAARRCGFSNVNVDIMSALPGQTLEGYLDTLGKVLALEPQPEHISAYSLILEEGTLLWEQAERGELDLPDEDTDREMYDAAKRVLEGAGYVRYEISNYARPGYECRHNCGYWRRRDYTGFGIGAASLIDNVRFQNGEDLRAYLVNPTGCQCDRQVLSVSEQMEEFMFLGLRMTGGVSAKEFAACFGKEPEQVYGEVIQKNIGDGLLKWMGGLSGNPADRRLALTEKGLDLANYVMAQFLF